MSAAPYSFTMDPDNGSVVEPMDPTPPTDDTAEYHCRVCGKPLVYGGRGRKPVLCDEHKKGGTATKKGSPRPSTKNASLANDAAMALCNMHSMVAIGAGFTGFSHTSATIVEANDPFFEAARAALSTDPALCQRILASGAGTGSIALIVAYGMFLSAVVPAALNEARDKGAEKRRLREELEAE